MRKALRKRIRRTGDGLNLVADVNAVVASGAGRQGQGTKASARQRVRIVQRDGHSQVSETEVDSETGESWSRES